MRIVENALSISPLFFLFFSLPPPHHVSPAQFFYFLSDVASSPLVYFKEMRFPSCSFSISSAHTQQTIKKSVFRLGRPEIGFGTL